MAMVMLLPLLLSSFLIFRGMQRDLKYGNFAIRLDVLQTFMLHEGKIYLALSSPLSNLQRWRVLRRLRKDYQRLSVEEDYCMRISLSIPGR